MEALPNPLYVPTMEHNNAKHFALQLGALITLYVSLGSLIALLFGIITISFPDVINAYYEHEGATTSIRWGIALLVVFFPAYVTLTRMINVNRRATGASYLSITKWLIYLSLVVGGVVLLGDLVSVIYFFLNGDLTVRFLLKALSVLGVVGLAFTYYMLDARAYWQTHEAQSKQYGLITGGVILVLIVFGYTQIETPREVRDMRLDTQQINDLTTIQSFIESSYSMNGVLPETLDELSDRNTIPTAPEGRASYSYMKTGTTTFELCATFAVPSSPNQFPSYTGYTDVGIKNPYDWNHKTGRTCFPRIMNDASNAPMVTKPIM